MTPKGSSQLRWQPEMTSFTILYDMIRWEEKAIAEAAKKKGVEAHLVDAREMALDITAESSGIA